MRRLLPYLHAVSYAGTALAAFLLLYDEVGGGVCGGGGLELQHSTLHLTHPSDTDHSPSIDSLLTSAKTACFIGDSVTAGSENGGHPWYTPLVAAFSELKTHQLAVGGGTSKSLLEMCRNNLQHCDVYVIALGTNDVRYRDAEKGAMTSEDYICNLNGIVTCARSRNPAGSFIFIAPWCSIPDDPIPPISRAEKEKLLTIYSKALQQYCMQERFCFIDPNPLLSVLIKYPALRKHYMNDHIHPTHPHGCYLYSAAVWEAGTTAPVSPQ